MKSIIGLLLFNNVHAKKSNNGPGYTEVTQTHCMLFIKVPSPLSCAD